VQLIASRLDSENTYFELTWDVKLCLLKGGNVLIQTKNNQIKMLRLTGVTDHSKVT